ncbi:hypothetical protein HUN59_14875 [Curtobacterium sp. Csp2]|uniref:hypothetical protein n=1 Tax=Curtobacterium sp. Csp2 TaxID=2495430 RepID=UPI00157FFAF7|nr:hypothetical protein [Curtobacterium sp. Csp2]QKS17322.1 hypothetical protein HUN59_14875 [Curtobacterium sp. Csp2]
MTDLDPRVPALWADFERRLRAIEATQQLSTSTVGETDDAVTVDQVIADAAIANDAVSDLQDGIADANAGVSQLGDLIDASMSELDARLELADTNLDVARAALADAQQQISDAFDQQIDGLSADVDTAITRAGDAASAASTAQSSATSAGQAASAADTKAANAQTAANAAQTTANNAGQAAAAAQTTADTAKANAATAQAQADTARSNATAAQARADLAAFATFSSDRDTAQASTWLRALYPVSSVAGTIPSYAMILAAAPTASSYVADGATLASGLGDQYIGLLRTMVQVPSAKTFTVNLQHDDGAQFYVDGVSVYSRGTSSGSVIAVSFTLSAGWHVLDLLWAEQAGGDGIFNVSPTFSSQVTAMYAPVSLQSRAADAAQALTNAQTAQTAANTAKSAADAAQASANTAKSAADAAQATANNAGQAAAAAQTTADQAKTNAATAQSAADTAKAAADTAAAKAVAIAGGVLTNGGAEFDFDSWDASSKGTIAVQTTKVRSGSKAWQATTSGEIRQGMFPVKPGDTWRYRWWAQAVNTGTGSVTGGLRLQKYDASASSPAWSDAGSSTAPTSSAFTMQEITYTVPASGVTHLRARIAFANAAGVTVYFDDVELVNITDATAAAQAAATASAAAATAQSTADTAKTNAATAQSAADAAKTAAAAAQSTADTAKANAATAQTAADNANSQALSAAGIANGKGRVIYQASAPTGANANAQNLWIRTTDNTPWTYDATNAKWVQVTDQTAKDAATAAATAQQAATAASNAAAAAQATADGRPQILFSSSAGPSGTAPTGTIWFLWDSAKNVAGQWLQSGTLASPVWTPQQIKSEVIANLDVAKLTAGSAAIATLVAQKIAASTANFQTANVSNLFVTSGATLSQAVIDFLFTNVVQAKKITAGMIDVDSLNGITITGAIVQTGSSGKRAVLGGNLVRFFADNEAQAGQIEGLANGANGGMLRIAPDSSSSSALLVGSQSLPQGGTVAATVDSAYVNTLYVNSILNYADGQLYNAPRTVAQWSDLDGGAVWKSGSQDLLTSTVTVPAGRTATLRAFVQFIGYLSGGSYAGTLNINVDGTNIASIRVHNQGKFTQMLWHVAHPGYALASGSHTIKLTRTTDGASASHEAWNGRGAISVVW